MRKLDILIKLKEKLLKYNFSICTAESCTGGLIAKTITDLPGCSKYFAGGVVTYQNEAKEKVLKISKSMIDNLTAVSEPVAENMAVNVRELYSSDFSISTTGYAGPNIKGSKDQVGLVFIGIASNEGSIVYKENFNGTRVEIREKAAKKALEYLLKYICDEISRRNKHDFKS